MEMRAGLTPLRRNSGTGSRATRSPPPAGLRPAIPQPMIRESPPTPSTSSSSPASIPTPVASPSRPTKAKRRRESGLLLPQRVESPEASGETSDWDEGSQVQLSPEDAQALINDEAEVEAAIEDELREMAIEDGPPEATSLVGSAPLAQVSPPIQLGDSLSPSLEHLGTSPAMSSMSVSEAALDDDGGRGRRSRKSVNYKEPNLTRCVSVSGVGERALSGRACEEWCSSVHGVVVERARSGGRACEEWLSVANNLQEDAQARRCSS